MKKITTLALIFTVTYNLNFKAYHTIGREYEVTKMVKQAASSKDLVNLLKTGPDENARFECSDKTGRKGRCFITDLNIVEVSR